MNVFGDLDLTLGMDNQTNRLKVGYLFIPVNTKSINISNHIKA